MRQKDTEGNIFKNLVHDNCIKTLTTDYSCLSSFSVRSRHVKCQHTVNAGKLLIGTPFDKL